MKINIKNTIYTLSLFLLVILVSIYLKPILIANKNFMNEESPFLTNLASVKNTGRKGPVKTVPTIISSFIENFDLNFTVKEAGSIDTSSSPKWWLSSGGYLYSLNGEGSTIIGELPSVDPWRFAYYISNPIDTDNGYHPQNIFRLVEKNPWKNLRQEVYFKIKKNNLSESSNRNASNGLLLFSRYHDQYNLYYTGIRVDGYAVIKKKTNGVYYTLAYKPIFTTNNTYNKESNPNLIPQDTWIGIKSETVTNRDNTVSIKVYMDQNKTGNWTLIAEAVDNGKDYGGDAITTEGFAGIRTDFMDVLFDNYKINSL